MASNMIPWQGGWSHWLAVMAEIEKTGRSEATAAAAGTAVPQHETPRVYAPKIQVHRQRRRDTEVR